MTRAELARNARDGLPRRRLRASFRAPFEGTTSTSTSSRRPDLLAPLGRAIADAVREHEPDAVRLAGPELGEVALAAAASLESNLPFLIVRKEAKDYGTSKRLEGVFEPGERICLVEDVVTTGGAALEAVLALREAGLQVSNAICVVDREEGGVDAFARQAVRLWPLYRASELRKNPANPHG